MGVSSLRQVISGSFVTGLSKVGQSASAGQAVAQAASGSKGPTLDVSLRTGAKNFAQGLQALNVAISYINVSRVTNQQLLDVVDQMDLLVTKAAKGSVTGQAGVNLRADFEKLGRQFQNVLKGAVIKGSDVLDMNDLSSILVRAGLDPEKTSTVSDAIKGFTSLSSTGSDKSEASSGEAVRLPIDEFSRGIRDTAASIGEAIDAGDVAETSVALRHVRDQLREVRRTLKGNVDALNDTVSVIGDNITLTRAAGNALLDMSSTVKGSEQAQEIADQLQRQIRRNAPQALAQASNLQAIMVAGLTLTADTFTKK